MVFSSLGFLFWFLPIFFILYYAAGRRYSNSAILLGSLVFYAYGEPLYVLLMLFCIVVNYGFACGIAATYRRGSRNKAGKRKIYLFLAMLFDFGLLFFFKYLNFCIGIFNDIAGGHVISIVAVTLPLGISFYMFQMASYVIDVYMKKDSSYVDDGILSFSAYVCMFPQLIAGPIVNYSEVRQALRRRVIKFKEIEAGLSVFIVGLAYKVLLANKIGSLWNDVQTIGPYGINTETAWLGSLGFTMQIYFDFFGYSLMAIGLGKMMGFDLPQNFDHPYVSRSATEFWRRWHITLGRWFRDYVYIPLGGSRKGTVRLLFNTFVVWFLTGLWHGANWNFIIWGMLFFIVLMVEKLFLKKVLDRYRILSFCYMAVLIPVSWTVFNISDLRLLSAYLRKMFFLPLEIPVVGNASGRFAQLFERYWWLLLLCILFCTPYPGRIYEKVKDRAWLKIFLFVVFWFIVYELVQGGSNPFLYFRF